jgi:hypothetical protein
MSYDLSHEMVRDAFADFFKTTEGQIALSALQAVLVSVPAVGSSPCALRDHTGMRRMAQILVSMATKREAQRRDDAGNPPTSADSAGESRRLTRRRGPARDIPGGRRP